MDQNFGLATLLTTLLPLAVILACLMAVAYFGRRIKSGRFGRVTAPQSDIAIIATRSFGPQSSLLIIEAEGHRFLVSAGRHGFMARSQTCSGSGWSQGWRYARRSRRLASSSCRTRCL